MPQPRQRIVFCDCLDCVEQAAATDIPTATSAANEAAAKQEPPPKCLLLHLSGLLLPGHDSQAPTILERTRLPHLDRATKDGCLNLLAARQPGDAGVSQELAELEQLLARCQPPPGSVNVSRTTPAAADSSTSSSTTATLQQRWKGLQVLFASNRPAAAEYAASLGCAPAVHLQKLLQQVAVDLQQSPPSPPHKALLPGSSTAAAAPPAAGTERTAAAALREQLEPAAAAAAAGQLPGLTSAEGLPDAAEVARAILEQLDLRNSAAGADMLLLHLDGTHVGSSSSSSGVSTNHAGGTGNQAAAAVVSAAAGSRGHEAPSSAAVAADSSASAAAAAGGCSTEQAVQLLTWVDRVLRYLNNEPLVKEAVLLVVVLTPPPGVQLPPPSPQQASQLPEVNADGDGSSSGGWLVPGGAVLHKVLRPQQAAAGGSAAGEHGTQQQQDEQQQKCSEPQQQQQRQDRVGVLRPLQSWQLSGGVAVAADPLRPLLCLRRLPGVIRQDGCSKLGLLGCYSQGGMGPMLLERLLPEVAYKLGRAPKYGA